MLFGVPRRVGLPLASAAEREVFGKPDVFVRERPAFARFIDRGHPKDIAVGTIADHELDQGQALGGIGPENLPQFVDGTHVPESKPPPAGLPGAAQIYVCLSDGDLRESVKPQKCASVNNPPDSCNSS